MQATQQIAGSGKEYVVDIDLSKFFDRVHHDRLIARLSQFVTDKRILRIIGMTLCSGIMKDGLVTPSRQGTVQGSPLTQYPSQLVKIEAHIRRRLRARLVDQQKGKRNLFKKLVKRGVPRKMAGKAAYSNRRRWALSHTLAMDIAYPNRYFVREMGLKSGLQRNNPTGST